MHKIIHWQLSEFNQVISNVVSIRDNKGREFLKEFNDHFKGPKISLEDLVAVLMGGVYTLVLMSNSGNGYFLGIDTNDPKGQERISRTIDFMVIQAWEAVERDKQGL